MDTPHAALHSAFGHSRARNARHARLPAAKDADNVFSLYEDDGISLDYQKGIYSTTALRYTQKGNRACVTVAPAEGSYPGQTMRRSYRLQLPGLKDGAKVTVNGKKPRLNMTKPPDARWSELPPLL